MSTRFPAPVYTDFRGRAGHRHYREDSFWTRFMGILGNPDHERFCQAAHKRIWAGERAVASFEAAYRETIYTGDNPEGKALAANVRKLRRNEKIKARLRELADYSAKLAGIEAGWALLKLKSLIEANLDDYLSPATDDGGRFVDLTGVSREKLGLLAELHMEDEVVIERTRGDAPRQVRKARLKLHDRIAALAQMARLAGWEKPRRGEISGPDGGPISHYIMADRPLTDDEWEKERAFDDGTGSPQ